MPTSRDTLIRQVRQSAASRAGDAEWFLNHCTEDTEWTFVGDRVLKGKAEVREWMKEAYNIPPDFTVHRMLVDGDFLTAIGEIATRGKDGTVVVNAYCHIWRFRDGLLARLHAFVIEGKLARDGFA